MSSSTIEKIIDIAESQVRAGGYNSFSFREISKEIGIKSASIHYHFPTKADLGVAIASRYTNRFAERLYALSEEFSSRQQRLNGYIGLFRQALEQDKKMCLCGQLASESDVLPTAIKLETQRFFELNLGWLAEHVFTKETDQSALVIASLEGALLICKVIGSNDVFNQITTELHKLLPKDHEQ